MTCLLTGILQEILRWRRTWAHECFIGKKWHEREKEEIFCLETYGFSIFVASSAMDLEHEQQGEFKGIFNELNMKSWNIH